MADEELPEWLHDQVGRRYRGPRAAGYLSKLTIIRRFARDRAAAGQKVDHEVVRRLLERLDRGYSTSAKEISAALALLRASGVVTPFPNGHGVSVEGKPYRSIREAAHQLGIGVETVRRRLSDPAYPGWTRQNGAE
jgi:hypothetical protein